MTDMENGLSLAVEPRLSLHYHHYESVGHTYLHDHQMYREHRHPADRLVRDVAQGKASVFLPPEEPMSELDKLKTHRPGSQATNDAIRLKKSFLLQYQGVRYFVQRGGFATPVDDDGKRTGVSVHVSKLLDEAAGSGGGKTRTRVSRTRSGR